MKAVGGIAKVVEREKGRRVGGLLEETLHMQRTSGCRARRVAGEGRMLVGK